MLAMNKQYGKIARVGGLVGHPDLLFIFDGDEIRKVFQREEVQPHRYCITFEQKLQTVVYNYRFALHSSPFTQQTLHAFLAPLQDDAA